jgi:hypothetical protein
MVLCRFGLAADYDACRLAGVQGWETSVSLGLCLNGDPLFQKFRGAQQQVNQDRCDAERAGDHDSDSELGPGDVFAGRHMPALGC